MISESSLSAFTTYTESLHLNETSQREMATFIAKARSLQPSALEKIHESFRELRTVFSQETLAAAPTLTDRIDELERAAEQAAHVDEVAQPLLRAQLEDVGLSDQAAAAALREELVRLRSCLTTHNFRIDNPLPFFLDEKTPYRTWVRQMGDGTEAINIQILSEFSDKSSKNKLGFSIDESGNFLSVWENGEDTHTRILPQKWDPIVRAAAKNASSSV